MFYRMGLTIRSVFAVAFLFVFVLLPANAFAQDSAGIGLSPSLIEAGADPGEVLKRSVTVTNLSRDEQEYFLYTRDISGVNDGGAPIFAEENTERTGYELTEWITLSADSITLLPGQERTIEVTIAVPETASPGSHFGGIFISKEPPRLRSSGAGVGFQVANIVSIRVAGDAVENAQIRSFSTDQFVYGAANVEFLARIENKGNVLVRPVGPLEIHNMFGSKVATVIFNDSQNGVFPNSVRDFKLVWANEGLNFGRYEASLSVVYGEQGKSQSTISSSATFWILPMQIIKPALIVLGVLLIGSYIAVRLYVRRTVARMSGGRRLVRRQQRGPSTLLLVAIVMLVVTVIFLILLLALFA